MKMKLMSVVIMLMLASSAFSAQDDRIREIERKIDLLTEEFERIKIGEAAEPKFEKRHGFAPAASKVYHKTKGVSIGGYGEMVFQDFANEKDDGTASGKKAELDFLRAIVYFGYKFSDRILFNSEIEFEHASSGVRGEISVEFAYLDFLLDPRVNVRSGLLLVPMGFVNELHEPPTFHGANRPSVEKNLIPTTWRDNGVGLFGAIGPVEYRTYVLAGMQAIKDGDVSGFKASNGLRSGRTKGSKSQAEDVAWASRVDFVGLPGVLLGGSFYTGRAGQNEKTAAGADINAEVTFWDLHGSAEYRGAELRALYAQGVIGDVTQINDRNGLTGNSSVGERLFGGYVQAAVNVLSRFETGHYLAPFFRYERYDTQMRVPGGFTKDPANSRIEYTFGLTYKPIPNVVVKLDYQDMDNQAGTGIDQINLALGYHF